MKTEYESKNRWWMPLRRQLALWTGVLLLGLSTSQSSGQTYTILHTFGTNTMGQSPYSQLVQGPDGTLYGTTDSGGVHNSGQVFKVNPDGKGYTVLKDFTGLDGAWPDAGLVLSGATLYGTTWGGGTNDNGTVYKVNTDGTGFAVLKQFTGYDGANSDAKLVLSGTVLYGTTSGGGAFGNGTVFKVDTDGAGFSVLKHFTGHKDGAWPDARLVLSGTTLYGTASGGGGYGNGTVFKINLDGSGFAVLKSFTGGSDGGGPSAGLTFSGETLYGTAFWGGNSGNGTVFKLNTDGSGFDVLKDFTDNLEGVYPDADLILSGTTLYGTAENGGASWNGTVFKVNTDGSGFAVLKDFTNSLDGAYCSAGLLLSGTTLYGTAPGGGYTGSGTVFKLETDGSAFTVITQLAGGDGVNPSANLTLCGSTIYGTTAGGGSLGNGTVFSVNVDGSGYAILHNFTMLTATGSYTTNADGASPVAGLVLSGTTLYGSAASGGEFGMGTVFRINTDGTGFTVLKEFNGDEGGNPYGTLILADSTLYGMAEVGGVSGIGTVFSVNTDGTGFTVLKEFNGEDGAYPVGSLVSSGGTLYGTTQSGGDFGNGTVFAVNIDGSGFTNLYSFTGGSDGANPHGALFLSGSTLYGTTQSGGDFGDGTVFAVNTDGTSFTNLYTGGSDGANPQAGLSLSGDTLYGMTEGGGIFWHGTVFEINTDGSGYNVLKYFTGDDGADPRAGLVLSDTTLYGTTCSGGSFSSGVLFSLSLLAGTPQIQMQPQSQTVQLDSSVTFVAVAGGVPTAVYQWFLNGNIIDGATNYSLELDNLQGWQAGDYTVVVTNSYGSVTSQVATLTVQDPFINGQPASQLANAGDTIQFSVDAGGTGPLNYQWFKDGMSLGDGGNVSGAQTATLTLSNVLQSDTAQYSVNVSNTHNSVTSEPALLIVQDPFVPVQPWSQSIHLGEPVEFSVLAYGTALNFQWQIDGSSLNDGGNVSGTQTSTLRLENVSLTNSGGYSVIVSNTYGSITSAVAGLVVVPPGNYSVLHHFTGQDFNADGSSPAYAELVVSGSTLYGTTSSGGTNGGGTVFKLNIDRTGYELLHSFSTPDEGWDPAAGLVLSGTTLYGTAEWGGEYGWGTIYKVNTDGSGYSVLKSFTGNDGKWQESTLILSGSTLYGTCSAGGFSSGTVFKINTDGSGYAVLHNFGAVANDGGRPNGKLVLSGTTLYGVTGWGGSFDRGTVFKINTDGSDYSILYNFPVTQYTGSASTNADGAWPNGSLVLSGATLYGATGAGGINGVGTVFKLYTDGSDFGILYDFTATQFSGSADTNTDGAWPNGSFILSGATLYGTTEGGGINGEGTIFRVNTDGSDFRVLKQFAGDDGFWPRSGLLLAGSALYGTTMSGGMSNNGVVFGLSLLPCVATPPQSQTVELGSNALLEVNAGGDPMLTYLWFSNATNLLSCGAENFLVLTNADLSMSATYTVVVTNAFGAETSAPVALNVIPAVERRPVPGVRMTGEIGSSLNVEHAESFGSVPIWSPLGTVNLTNPPQFCFDLTTPLPPQRFYRAWQTGTPGVVPVLNLNFVQGLTLTGNIGEKLRLDCINQIGPTDAWVTLDTVALTNTSQLYFDTSAIGQPARLYRIVPVP